MFGSALISVLSSFAKREVIALLGLFSCCLVTVSAL